MRFPLEVAAGVDEVDAEVFGALLLLPDVAVARGRLVQDLDVLEAVAGLGREQGREEEAARMVSSRAGGNEGRGGEGGGGARGGDAQGRGGEGRGEESRREERRGEERRGEERRGEGGGGGEKNVGEGRRT